MKVNENIFLKKRAVEGMREKQWDGGKGKISKAGLVSVKRSHYSVKC